MHQTLYGTIQTVLAVVFVIAVCQVAMIHRKRSDRFSQTLSIQRHLAVVQGMNNLENEGSECVYLQTEYYYFSMYMTFNTVQ